MAVNMALNKETMEEATQLKGAIMISNTWFAGTPAQVIGAVEVPMAQRLREKVGNLYATTEKVVTHQWTL